MMLWAGSAQAVGPVVTASARALNGYGSSTGQYSASALASVPTTSGSDCRCGGYVRASAALPGTFGASGDYTSYFQSSVSSMSTLRQTLNYTVAGAAEDTITSIYFEVYGNLSASHISGGGLLSSEFTWDIQGYGEPVSGYARSFVDYSTNKNYEFSKIIGFDIIGSSGSVDMTFANSFIMGAIDGSTGGSSTVTIKLLEYPDNVSVITDVPEPATWLTMIVGFGLIGGAFRRRYSPALKSTSAL